MPTQFLPNFGRLTGAMIWVVSYCWMPFSDGDMNKHSFGPCREPMTNSSNGSKNVLLGEPMNLLGLQRLHTEIRVKHYLQEQV